MKETCEWYMNQCKLQKDDKSSFVKRLEAVLLAVLYNYAKLEHRKDYNWHVAMSEVHDPKEAKIHKIYTSHYQLIRSSENT